MGPKTHPEDTKSGARRVPQVTPWPGNDSKDASLRNSCLRNFFLSPLHYQPYLLQKPIWKIASVFSAQQSAAGPEKIDKTWFPRSSENVLGDRRSQKELSRLGGAQVEPKLGVPITTMGCTGVLSKFSDFPTLQQTQCKPPQRSTPGTPVEQNILISAHLPLLQCGSKAPEGLG